MSEETEDTKETTDTPGVGAEDASPNSTQTHPYPARDADNGEEQKNRLGYMATEPTEEEIRGDESDEKTGDA